MRKWPWISLLLVAAAMFSPIAGRAATTEEGAAAVFTTFRQALAAHDGPNAAKYVDDRTMAFYEKLRRAALKMPKDQLLKQPLFFQIGVFATRLQFTRGELESAEGRNVYAKLAAAGEAGTADIFDTLILVKIQPTKPGASVVIQVSLAGNSESVGLRIFSEGGGWKIDFSRLLEAQTKELQKQIGVAPGALKDTVQLIVERDLFPILAKRSGKPVSEKLWIPLIHAN